MEKDGRHEVCGAVKDPARVKGAALEATRGADDRRPT